MASIDTLFFIVLAIQVITAGGVQTGTGIVAPVLSGIGNIFKSVQENVDKTAGNLVQRFGNVGGFLTSSMSGSYDLLSAPLLNKSDSWEKIFSRNFSFEINDVNINDVISKAGVFLGTAVKSGLLLPLEAGSVASAIVNSALQKTLNPIAALVDLLDKAVHKIILLQKQALNLFVNAVKEGLHWAEGATDTALNAFLDTAVKTSIISQQVADQLKTAKSEDKDILDSEKTAQVENKKQSESGNEEKTKPEVKDKS